MSSDDRGRVARFLYFKIEIVLDDDQNLEKSSPIDIFQLKIDPNIVKPSTFSLKRIVLVSTHQTSE